VPCSRASQHHIATRSSYVLQVAQLHGSDAQGPSVDAEGFLTWPVLLAYPEHGQTDFVEQFHEASCLQDHLQVRREAMLVRVVAFVILGWARLGFEDGACALCYS